MAIGWGKWDRGNQGNGLRIGFAVSHTKVSHGSNSVKFTIKAYVGDYYHYNSGMDIHFGGVLSGSKHFQNNWGKNGGGSNIGDYRLVETKTYTYTYGSNEYGKSPGKLTFKANITGSYDNATPNYSVTVSIPGRPIAKPAAPTNVKLTRNSSGGTTVKWTPHRMAAAPYDSIQIQRREYTGNGPYSSWSHAAWAPASAKQMWVKGQSSNAIYDYRVRARNSKGYSAFNKDSSGIATTPAAPSNVTVKRTQNGAALQVSWTHNAYSPSPANTVQIQRTGAGQSGWSTVATLNNATSTTSWTDANPLPGDNQYRVREQVQYGVGPHLWSAFGTSKVISALVPPLKPINLDPDGEAIDGQDPVDLSWKHRDGGDGQDQTRAEIQLSEWDPGVAPPGWGNNLARNASFTSMSGQLDGAEDIYSGGGATVSLDTTWSSDGSTSLKVEDGTSDSTSAYVNGRANNSNGGSVSLADFYGETITVSVDIHMEEAASDLPPTTGTFTPHAIVVGVSGDSGADLVWKYAASDEAPNQPGTHRLTTTFTLPESTDPYTVWFIRLTSGSQTVPVWWDRLVIERGSTSGDWVPPTTFTVDGDVEHYEVPADTFANGYGYTWRVRTMGDPSQGYGPWSDWATLTASTTPTVSLVLPEPLTHTGHITASWTYAQAENLPQTYWHAMLWSSEGAILEERHGYDDTSSTTFAYHLQDGETYTVTVTVRSSGGLEAADQAQTTADFPLPAEVSLETEWFPCSGAMTLQLKAREPQPAEEHVNLAYNPTLEPGGGSAVIATNLCPIPSFSRGTGTTGADGLWNRQGSAENITVSSEWSAEGDGGQSMKIVPTSGSRDSRATWVISDADNGPFAKNTDYTLSATLHLETPQLDRGNDNCCCIVVATHTPADGWIPINVGGHGTARSAQPPNEVGDHEVMVTFSIPDEVDQYEIRLYNGQNQNAPTPVYWDHVMAVPGDTPPQEYFDGDTDSDDYLTYAWTGTAGRSPSIKSARAPKNWYVNQQSGGGMVIYSSGSRQGTLVCGTAYSYALASIEPGSVVNTVLVTLTSDQDNTISLGIDTGSPAFDFPLQAGVTTRVQWDVGGLTGSQLQLGWRTSNAIPGSTLVVSDVMVSAEPNYSGSFFSGDTENADGWRYAWTGDPYDSTSTKTRQAEDPAVAVTIERQVLSDPDADWVTLAEEVDLPVTLLDVTAPLRGEVAYRPVPVSAIPAYRTQDLEVVTLPQGIQTTEHDSPWNPRLYVQDPYEWIMLSWGDDFTTVLRVNGDVDVNDTSGGTRAAQPLLGHYRPGMLMGRNTTWGVSVSGTLRYADIDCPPEDDDGCRYDSLPDEWRQASKYAELVCYRDYTGRRIFGFLDGDVSVAEGPRPGMASLSFSVTELGYVESYQPLTGEVLP